MNQSNNLELVSDENFIEKMCIMVELADFDSIGELIEKMEDEKTND